MLTNLLLNQTAAEPLYAEDVFSSYLYTGTGASQTITNGIDLSGKGGLVWVKARSTSTGHFLFDTERGATKEINSNATDASAILTNSLTSFNSNGFTVNTATGVGATDILYCAWTFRKAQKFFDIVTWTGNGANRALSHNLGIEPGMILVKRTDTTANWAVYHRGFGATKYMTLNSSGAHSAVTNATRWNNTAPTSTEFTVGTDASVNASSGTYIAYLFAHDTSADGIIQCGSYAGNGLANGPDISLGWEPQFLFVKAIDDTASTTNWIITDEMFGMQLSANAKTLYANATSAENAIATFSLNPTGFSVNSASNPQANASGTNYLYMAIRRGPMRVPTDATKVFQPVVYTGTNVDNRLVDTTIAPDMVMVRQRNDNVLGGFVIGDRLRGQPYLLTGAAAAEVNDPDSFDQQLFSAGEYGTAFSAMNGFWCGNDATSKLNINTTASNHIALAFKRAPSYFDIVAYTGTGSQRTVGHNLGVAPELIIVTYRNVGSTWSVFTSPTGASNRMFFDADNASAAGSIYWGSTNPTSSEFTVGTYGGVNASGGKHIAYLFASCPSVSKVGSYTGNGSSQNIDCGFSAGARFVMIKRTDTTGDWYIWDTARGIVSGSDPFLRTNSTAAETTNDDSIDPLNAGFTVNQNTTTNVNVNNGTYIYLAIA